VAFSLPGITGMTYPIKKKCRFKNNFALFVRISGFTVLVLFLLITGSLTAQNRHQQIIDSLENVLKQPLHDSLKLQTINYLSYYYTETNEDRFLELAEEALKLIGSTKNKYEIAGAYFNNALAAEVKGEYIASLGFNAKALQLYQELGDTVSVNLIFNNIGIAYNQIGDYSMAVYYLLKGVEMDEQRGDLVSASIYYINLAESYYSAKSYEIALQWGRKAYNNLKGKDEYSMAYAAEMLAMTFIEVNKFDSTRYFVDISKAIATKYDNDYLINRNLSHMGRMFLKMKKYDSAEYYLMNTIQRSKGRNFSDLLLPSTLALAKCYHEQGKFKDALQQALWSYKSSSEIKNKILAMESCTIIAAIYESQNQKDATIKYLKLAADLRQKILEQSVQGSIQAKTFDLVIEKEKKAKLAAVKSLEERGKVLERQRYILITGTVVVIFLLAMLYLFRKINLERKKINAQLTQNNSQLNKLNQEINGLIHTIVHDLKSPFNSLQGILQIMQMESKGEPVINELIKEGHKVINRGHEIIRELLELRELEEKPVSLQLEETSLKLFVDQITAEYITYAQQKDITINASAPDVTVTLDKQLVKRLITNLISNAIKFSPKGKPVTINALTTEKNIIFEIIDEGPGFEPTDIEKMYNKFQRLSARPTGGESSNGLGLAIVDLLVKKLNASIDLKTEIGKGSAFTITVPIAA
jgi:signal transduction histidine kinase